MKQSKGEKIKQWLKQLWTQYWAVIVALIATPIILGLLLKIPFTNVDNGSNDGWLGFWGGYLASVITIVGVYWQVNRQSKEADKNLKLTFEEQAKQNAKMARPRFIFELSRQKLFDEDEYFLNASLDAEPENFLKLVEQDNPEITVVKIENVSDEVIVNALVKLIYRKKHDGGEPDKVEWFIIKRINPNATFLYVPKGSETSTNDADGIDLVDIWIITSTGENVYYRLVDSYSNQLFNTLVTVSKIDSPDSTSFKDRPQNNEYDGIRKNTDYDSEHNLITMV